MSFKSTSELNGINLNNLIENVKISVSLFLKLYIKQNKHLNASFFIKKHREEIS